MNPFSKSVWITPAHCGAFHPLWYVHAFTSISPAVMKVSKFKRLYAFFIRRLTPLSSRPSSSKNICLSSYDSSSAISSSVLAAIIIASAPSSAASSSIFLVNSFPVFAADSSTLHTYNTGFEVRRKRLRAASCSSFDSNSTVRAFLPCSSTALYASSTVTSTFASLFPNCATFCCFASRLSIVSRSFNCNSVSMISLSRIGSIVPSTCVMLSSSKQRRTWMIASVSRIFPRNLLPRPSPLLAPFTRPAISTISQVAGTMRPGCTSSASFVSLSSGTVITPTLGSIVQNGKFAACAFALDRQVNSVDFPTLGSPTIPHFNAIFLINVYNLCAKILHFCNISKLLYFFNS